MSLPCNKHPFYQQLEQQLDTTRTEGLYKNERVITSAQQANIAVADGSRVINFAPITI